MEAAREHQPLVLLVEDDEDIRTLFEASLTARGYRVETTGNGADALARLDRGGMPLPSVIVADLHMPVMDGWEFMTELAKRPTLRAVPLIILTAGDDPHRQAPRPDTILIKPVAMDDLIAAISAKLGSATQ